MLLTADQLGVWIRTCLTFAAIAWVAATMADDYLARLQRRLRR